MSYKTYENYKDSGIEWIGDIPQDWSVIKLKYLLEVISGGCWGEEDDDNSGTLVLRSTEITLDGKWDISEPAKRKLKNEEVSKCLLKENDLLVTKSSGSEKHIGKTAIVTKHVESLNCCFSNFMTRLHTNNLFNPKLLYYLLNSVIVKSQFNYMSNSTVGLSNLNDESFKMLLLPFMDMKFQHIIVDFLDKKTSAIDDNIAKNKEFISLLEEKKAALINQAVTKGLDQNVPMKDSGVEWIGEIPEYWQIVKLKFCTDMINDKKDTVDSNDKFIGLEHIESSTGKLIGFSNEGVDGSVNKFKENMVLFGKLRPYLAKVILASFEGVCSTEILVFLAKKQILPKFLFYVLLSNRFIEHINSSTYGVKMPRASPDFINNTFIMIPPVYEQEIIINFLDEETSKIDKTIEKIQENIDLLEEYKASLIYHVVTGKIDVRDEV